MSTQCINYMATPGSLWWNLQTGEREEPLIHCSKADVDVLLSHWDQQSERWRQVVSNACRQLHAAVLESGAYQPSPVHKLQVRPWQS